MYTSFSVNKLRRTPSAFTATSMSGESNKLKMKQETLELILLKFLFFVSFPENLCLDNKLHQTHCPVK